ncbi:MAG: antibiotic biosynthesis monooxygenase [Pseudomonadota bacterium]
MTTHAAGTIAVIFVSQESGMDLTGYAAAAAEMNALAAGQPGYVGIDSMRGTDGFGITVSYWVDDASAVAWRDNARHAEIREAGRGTWYDWYSLHVATVARSYDWTKP